MHTNKEILFSGKKKKKGILPFVTPYMSLEGIILSEISQIQEDKYFLISLLCGI